MNKTLLTLLLEGVLLSGAALADPPRFCQADAACAPCKDGDQDKKGCRSVNGKRIDRGASLGTLPVPANAERELPTTTFVLSDRAPLPEPAQAPAKAEAEAAPVAAAPEPPAAAPQAPATRVEWIDREVLQPGEDKTHVPLFISGDGTASGELTRRLDELVARLKGHGIKRIKVIGHTDPQRLSVRATARYKDNYGLGLARANTVAEYLLNALGLPPEGISAESRGPDVPVASNDTPEGMAQNRRAEIQVWYEDVTRVREEVVINEAPPPAPVPAAPVVQAPPPAPPAPEGMAPAPLESCAAVLASRTRAEDAPFRISVDGVPLNDTGVIDPDIQRCTDVALERAEVQIRYDALDQTPVLNAHAWPNAVARDGTVRLTGWSNYAAFIERAELRLFAPSQSTQAQSTQGAPIAVLPVKLGEPAAWSPNGLAGEHVLYVLRVYGKDGAFDETRPKRLELADQARPAETPDPAVPEHLAGYGENSLGLHNIPVRGGAVTANGTGVKPGETVYFLGQPVPVDAQGQFAARQILPAGNHVVAVELRDAQGGAARFARNLAIAADDWFYLGIADLTLGRNATSGPARLVTADATDHFDNQIYLDGRLAFYLKGKVKGEWLLTASADTREQPLKDLFSNFADKDPRYLLRRLDPDRYYPVYGDDSTAIDDAPTQGKFFVRLEKGDSQVMWGSFQTSLTGTEFTRFNRALYGARGRLVAGETTQYGEKRGAVELFAADPGTLQSREEFRGTGGSLYYLRNMDLTGGSERVWVEIRDKDSGLVLKTQPLVAVQDYEVNAIQGRVTLREALPSTAGAGTLVQSGGLSGHPVYLVVTYEYAPGVVATEDLVMGGRASTWVNDHIELGAAALRQDNAGQRQRLKGVDATFRYKPGTYVKAELARSEGAGSGAFSSLDGGFSFTAVPGGAAGAKADARRIEAALDLSELGAGQGKASVYWQDRDAGFSGPGQLTSEAITQSGASVSLTSGAAELLVKLDVKDALSQSTKAAEVNVGIPLNANWKLGLGLRGDDLDTVTANASPTLSQTGARADAQVRLDYTPAAADKADWKAYGYVQQTVRRDGTRADNDRVGVGGERRVSDRFKLGGELSHGDGGLGARLSGDWQVDDRSSLYTNYSLSTDRTDEGFRGRAGLLTAGGKTRYADSVSVFAEERFQHGEGPAGLIHAFGLDYSPDDRWTYGLKAEAGDLADPLSGDMERRALGFSLGYRKDATRYAGALEYRHESGANKRRTWLLKNTLGYQIDPDWRFLGRLNTSISNSSQGAAFDGDYLELVTGYAWRPVANDRWNTLVKYTYLYNLPAPGQVDRGGAMLDYAQKSHVLALDTLYDIRPWVSVGGKLGLRRGELKDAKAGGTWHDATAWLAVLRADWHWVHEWDLLTELRFLDASDAGDSQAGALLAVYKHLGKHFKLGGGYNFTDFSDDLTDVSYRSHGWFVNLIGKM